MRAFPLFQQIDLYCERTDFSFWAEPLNALTNGFILLAGIFGLVILLRKLHTKNSRYWMISLSFMTIIIALGSFLFHTIATQWAMLADVIPITLFMFLFLFYGLRYILQLKWAQTTLWMGIFLIAGALLELTVPKTFLNGSGSYLHALAAMMIIGHLVRKSHPAVATGFIHCIGLFSLSLAFRSIDLSYCQSIPFGTHFLWHSLNGAVLLSCLRIIHLNENSGLPHQKPLLL